MDLRQETGGGRQGAARRVSIVVTVASLHPLGRAKGPVHTSLRQRPGLCAFSSGLWESGHSCPPQAGQCSGAGFGRPIPVRPIGCDSQTRHFTQHGAADSAYQRLQAPGQCLSDTLCSGYTGLRNMRTKIMTRSRAAALARDGMRSEKNGELFLIVHGGAFKPESLVIRLSCANWSHCKFRLKIGRASCRERV
jgi:hypothetical protein